MSLQLALNTGARGNSAASNLRSTNLVVASATNKPSTHKHFAFAATYAAYAKRGSWSSIG
ncbi:MAG: hypothetical protein F2696_00810 [Actinobacteria bacterium]|uniref:Unannotated protein n=1 Tax=freshwater metagenome TaxID=449393 RepID=A0A6J6S186_9ZZZZ|nr:hypothetical protein [Actinomycetota bacterium]